MKTIILRQGTVFTLKGVDVYLKSDAEFCVNENNYNSVKNFDVSKTLFINVNGKVETITAKD